MPFEIVPCHIFNYVTMSNFKFLLCALILFYGSTYGQSGSEMKHDDGTTHTMINKSDIKWVDGPAGLPAGAKIAVLSGDPSKEGPFTIRATMPANYYIQAHWHPTTENVAVLEGSLFMGSGEKLDEKSAMELTVGGFSSIPAKAPHFVFTKTGCVIQINAVGPFAITYFNPADDPRNNNK